MVPKAPYRGSSRALVLATVRLHAPITRVEIARHTGLTAAAVSNLVAGLISEGFVEETRRRTPKRGQPPIELGIRAGAAYMLGVHLEHSLLTCALTDLSGAVLGEHTGPHTEPRPDAVLARITGGCTRLLTEAGLSKGRLLGVGLASIGPLDLEAGTINSPPFFPDWERVPLRQRLADALGTPVFLENNATAAAIGEYWYGEGRRYPNYLFVHLGVGVGGGLFLGGQVFRGSSFNAGEVGHMIVGPERTGPFAGTRGSLESYASLFALQHDLGAVRFGSLEATFAAGDGELLGWLERAATEMAKVAVSVDSLLDLDAVIFGGLLPKALLDHLVARTEAHRADFDNLLGRPHEAAFLPATTQADGAALGAAMLPVYDAFVHAPSEAGVFKSTQGGET